MKNNNTFTRFLLLVFIVFFNYSFVLQEIKEASNFIYWNKNKKLTWVDFLGKPPTKQGKEIYSAVTSSGFNCKFEYYEEQDSVVILIVSRINKNKSYYRSEDTTQNLLNHENLHFDIVELYARKLRKSCKNSKFIGSNLEQQFEILRKEIFSQKNTYQKLYDKETNHSKIKDKQKEWEKRVDKELKELEMYSDTLVKIKLY